MDKLWESLLEQAIALWPRLLVLAAILAASWVLARMTRAVLRRLAGGAADGRRRVLALAGGAAYVGIWLVGAVTALGSIGVNVSAMIAGLGLGGFALGFALRDVLSNMIAGVMVLLNEPFRVGERICVGASEGVVREINLRYTVLDGQDKTYLVPNSTLLTNAITVKAGAEKEQAPGR